MVHKFKIIDSTTGREICLIHARTSRAAQLAFRRDFKTEFHYQWITVIQAD